MLIKLKTSLAIGAAVAAPDPPCSITIEMANLGFNYKRILDHYYEGANIEDFKYKKR